MYVLLLPFCFLLLLLYICMTIYLYHVPNTDTIIKEIKKIKKINHEDIIYCFIYFEAWCTIIPLPWHHGWTHFVSVFYHAIQILRETNDLLSLSVNERTAILLAALLHDIDDRKLHTFIGTMECRLCPNACSILRDANCEMYTELVVEMIQLVSASANGNQENSSSIWKYLPRYCDRLESIGWIGHFRLWIPTLQSQYNIYAQDTPFPRTMKEVNAILETRPIDMYVKNKGLSKSIIDYYYDKLLHFTLPSIQSNYLFRQHKARLSTTISHLLILNNMIYILKQTFQMLE
jgi:HD superfamily phosphodiesterase